MIGRVCLLLEALSIVICLHHLYGEKFKLDIKTVGFLAVDMIMMTAIDYYGLPSTLSIIIYLIIALYCGLEFGFEWKKIIINEMLCVIIVGVIQLLGMIIYCWGGGLHVIDTHTLILINSIVFLIILLLLPRVKIKYLSLYLQKREAILFVSLVISIILLISCIVNYKAENTFEAYQYVLLFTSVILICLLAAQLIKTRIRSKEIEAEFKMHKLYEASFENLIENIRLRQHEFDNHISTLFNQHYMYRTYDELVSAQKEYCNILLEENRFNNVLSKGNPVIICFLYSKFVEIDKRDIDIRYSIDIDGMDVAIPVYKLVEIIGDLINNATEAIEQRNGRKALFVAVIEKAGKFEIEVRNVSDYITQENIHMFFNKGFSRKGKNRGLGLYNVKKLCDEYSLKVICENKIIDEENWISFSVISQ